MSEVGWIFLSIFVYLLLIFAGCYWASTQSDAVLDRCIRAHTAGIALKECEQIERKP